MGLIKRLFGSDDSNRVPVPSLEEMKAETERLLGRSLTGAEYQFLLPKMEAERAIWLKDQRYGGIKSDAPPGAYRRYVDLLPEFNITLKSTEAAETTGTLTRLLTGPYLESIGYVPTYEGEKLVSIRKMTDEEVYSRMSPLERKQYDVAVETADRQMRALRGELEIDPALTKELEDQEKLLREGLSRRLGTGYEATTVGQVALRKFSESASRIRESARRGQIEAGQGLLTGGISSVMGIRGAQLAEVSSAPQFSAAAIGPMISSLQPYQFQRQLEFAAAEADARRKHEKKMATVQFYRELLGLGAGAALAYATGGASIPLSMSFSSPKRLSEYEVNYPK